MRTRKEQLTLARRRVPTLELHAPARPKNKRHGEEPQRKRHTGGAARSVWPAHQRSLTNNYAAQAVLERESLTARVSEYPESSAPHRHGNFVRRIAPRQCQ